MHQELWCAHVWIVYTDRTGNLPLIHPCTYPSLYLHTWYHHTISVSTYIIRIPAFMYFPTHTCYSNQYCRVRCWTRVFWALWWSFLSQKPSLITACHGKLSPSDRFVVYGRTTFPSTWVDHIQFSCLVANYSLVASIMMELKPERFLALDPGSHTHTHSAYAHEDTHTHVLYSRMHTQIHSHAVERTKMHVMHVY